MTSPLPSSIQNELSSTAVSYLNEVIEKSVSGEKKAAFHMGFGRVYKFVEQQPLQLWLESIIGEVLIESHLDLARIYLVENVNKDIAKEVLIPLFETGSNAELVSLYRSLPFTEANHLFLDQAIEGVRTNVIPVFAPNCCAERVNVIITAYKIVNSFFIKQIY